MVYRRTCIYIIKKGRLVGEEGKSSGNEKLMITDSLLGCGIGTVGAGDNFKKVGGT